MKLAKATPQVQIPVNIHNKTWSLKCINVNIDGKFTLVDCIRSVVSVMRAVSTADCNELVRLEC